MKKKSYLPKVVKVKCRECQKAYFKRKDSLKEWKGYCWDCSKKRPTQGTLQWRIRAKKIYSFYLNFLFRKGRCPTLEEIGKEFNFTKSRAGQILKKMAEEGYLLKLDRYHSAYIPDLFSGIGIKKGRKIKITN